MVENGWINYAQHWSFVPFFVFTKKQSFFYSVNMIFVKGRYICISIYEPSTDISMCE